MAGAGHRYSSAEMVAIGTLLLAGAWRPQRAAWLALPGDAAANERSQHGEAVAPGDFLAFVILAARIGDRHLVDAIAGAQNLGGDLGVEAPSRLAQVELARHVRREHFVASFHVGQRRVVE